jgi:hypothetical protein
MEKDIYLSLNQFSVFMFRFREFGVDVFDDTFERSEFHHRVRNLTTPERLETFVEARERLAFFEWSKGNRIESDSGQ